MPTPADEVSVGRGAAPADGGAPPLGHGVGDVEAVSEVLERPPTLPELPQDDAERVHVHLDAEEEEEEEVESRFGGEGRVSAERASKKAATILLYLIGNAKKAFPCAKDKSDSTARAFFVSLPFVETHEDLPCDTRQSKRCCSKTKTDT